MTTDNDEIYEGRVARDEKNYPAMTHDELLARLLVTDKTNMTIEVIKWQLALRAVVELHKPFQVATGGSWTPEGSTQTFETTCNHCGQLNSAAMVLYPCPTIQKIMDELK